MLGSEQAQQRREALALEPAARDSVPGLAVSANATSSEELAA
jgi:hypothetical protein